MTLNRIYSFLLIFFLIYPLYSYAHLYYGPYDTNNYYDDSENSYAYDGRAPHSRARYNDYYDDSENSYYYEERSSRSRTRFYEISGSPYATQNAPLPASIRPPLEKVIVIDPNEHAWGDYSSKGKLVRWGIATAGGDWCPDIDKPCRTRSGAFRIYSMGDVSCISKKFPVPVGGAPMPYCMYFNGGQALHGSNEVVYDNVSHGCVRLHVGDARWLRYQFVENPNSQNKFRGTKVIIRPYY
jgi:lipoprotein-anchoring transpeptidase ErfK/SrfK